jgi:hypothetical protein
MNDIHASLNMSGVDVKDIPESLISEQTETRELSKNFDLDEIVPFVLERKKLMSPGVWNGIYYNSDTIGKAFSYTNWDERKNRDLFLDHEDERTSEWVGEVKNIEFKANELYGDLYIYDLPTAIKLKYGKPKIGISPALAVRKEMADTEAESFLYKNFSLVINPACKTTFINNAQESFNVKEVKRMTDVEQVNVKTEPVHESTPVQEEGLAKKKDEEKYPPATTPPAEPEKKPEEDAVLSAYTEFFKKMKAKGWDPAKISQAWSAKQMAEQLSESELGTMFEEMKCKPKAEEYPAPKELTELQETVETLSEKIDKLASEPERLSVKSSGSVIEQEANIQELSNINYKDVDWEMAEYLKKEVTQ